MERWISATIGLGIGAMMVLYFVYRKPMAFASVAAQNRITLVANGTPKDVLDAVVGLSRSSRYTLGKRDDASGTVVLQEPLSFFNYGCLFQVEVKPDGADKSVVHVAITGKSYQWGPAFRRSKRQFLEALQMAIGGRPVPA